LQPPADLQFGRGIANFERPQTRLRAKHRCHNYKHPEKSGDDFHLEMKFHGLEGGGW